MRKILTLLSFLMLVGFYSHAQTRTVTGRITDENGQPIPFATVTVKGTSKGTSADQQGRFSIQVTNNDVLVISSAGYTGKEITVGNQTTINTSLVTSAAATLQEVVVTGAYGIKREQRVTPFSSQVIGDQQLHIIPQTNLNNALAGKIAGVQFRGQSPMKLNSQGALRIRGGISLTGDVSPIYVVDGNIANSFDINPDDVADVTVLKGANATALFGEAALGGAIVITTKKASAGRPTIEVNQGVTFDQVSILPKYQNLYAGGAVGDLMKFTWQPGMPDEWKSLDGKYYPDYTDDASWGPRMVGQEYIPWYAWVPGHAESGKTAALVPQPDNSKEFYRTGITSTTNAAFSRTFQGASVRLSYTNNSIRGMLPNTSSYRNTVFANVSFDLGEHFTAGTVLTYSNNILNGEFNDAYSNQSTGSFNSWFHRDLDMEKLKQYRALKTPIGTYPSWNLSANPSSPAVVSRVWKGNYWYNFFTYFDLINYKQNRDNITGNAFLTYKVNNSLKFTGTVRKRTVNNLYEFIRPTELEISATQTGELGSYATGQLKDNGLGFDLIGNYSQRFIDNKLNLNINVGAGDNRNQDYRAEMATSKGLNVPGLYAISNSKEQPTLSNARNKTENRFVFGSGDIEWNRVLDVNFAVRNDWYSVLLPDNNSLLSPSAGISFFFTDYTKNFLPLLSYGKIFGSWGRKPTAGLGAYSTSFTYAVNQNKWGTNFLTTTPNQAIDPNIHGQLLTTYEAGIDLKFSRNRYGLNLLYYNETSKDAPFSVPISGYSGFTSLLTNISLVKRTGLEAVLDAKIMNQKNFTWQLTKTFGYLLTNPVIRTDTAGNRVQISSGVSFQGIVPPRVYQVPGEEWGQLQGTGIKRLSNGTPVVNPANGNYVTENPHTFGTVVPKVTGGLVNTLTFKNIVLNFNIDYQIGGKFFSLSEMWGTYSGLLAPTAATNDRGWNVRDDPAVGGGIHVTGVSSVDLKTPVDMYVNAQDYFHSLGGNNAIADYFIHSLTFVKLREIGLGYELPVSNWGLNWVKGITATVVARNPLLIYRETQNFDPSEISGVYGENGQFPGTRSLGFNLRFNF